MEKIIKEVKDVQVECTTNIRDGFKRTALKIHAGTNTIDVLNVNGDCIATIGIFDMDNYIDVDVCRVDNKTNVQALAWAKGQQVLSEVLKDSSMVAVLLMK